MSERKKLQNITAIFISTVETLAMLVSTPQELCTES